LGLFDYVRSSYNLGEHFTDIELHTKDMERGLGGSMSHYWIDPSGQLFVMDYRDTHDIIDTIPLPLDEPNWWNPPFSYVPNGKHGKVSPVYLTDYVIVYPSQWDGDWAEWPECRIHLKLGKIQEFTDAKKGERFNMGY
jgi:hypothetical protein